MPLLALPPEILVAVVDHLNSTQDYLALSMASRQLRACCISVRPKTLRLLMERTLQADLGKDASEKYLEALKRCAFCEYYLEDEENRKAYRQTNPTRRYNLILNHETKDLCGGCLTLTLVLKVTWYPWYQKPAEVLRVEYLSAIKQRITDLERYSHDRTSHDQDHDRI
ncbi:hypothetical protein BDD12DRAFT_885826 [Trichophaea hybrida]|nr:hypothetical protein BDD12DRAFT_885826 [Trichophaea hybrida]